MIVDPAGNYYIADNGNNLIRKVDTTGIINSYLGFGATSGRLNHPNAFAFGPGNALYIADSNNNRIAKYTPYTANNVAADLTNFAGNLNAGFAGDGNLATLAQLNKPVGIAVDSAGNVYIADTNNSRIRKVSTDGTISTVAGKGGSGYSGDGGPATSAVLSFPRGIAIASNGTIYIADTNNHVIRALTPTFPTISGVGNSASWHRAHLSRRPRECLRHWLRRHHRAARSPSAQYRRRRECHRQRQGRLPFFISPPGRSISRCPGPRPPRAL